MSILSAFTPFMKYVTSFPNAPTMTPSTSRRQGRFFDLSSEAGLFESRFSLFVGKKIALPSSIHDLLPVTTASPTCFAWIVS